jgi:hypothetical protein
MSYFDLHQGFRDKNTNQIKIVIRELRHSTTFQVQQRETLKIFLGETRWIYDRLDPSLIMHNRDLQNSTVPRNYHREILTNPHSLTP